MSEHTGENLPPKPDAEPVNPVSEHEMNTLEQEGGEDVAFMQDDVAEADDTVDNHENDVPAASQPVPAPDTSPPAEVSPNDPTDDIVVTGDGPDQEPDDPINPVEQEQPIEDDEDMEPPTTAPESYEADPHDDGIENG